MTYEEIRAALAALETPQSDDSRLIEWIDEANRLGVARDAAGRFEVFLGTRELRAYSAVIRRRLRFDSWKSQADVGFRSTRLLLTEAPHYLPTAAFLVRELLNSGFREDTQEAFTKSEPLIEMVLLRGGLGDPSALGLVGELLLLRALVTASDTTRQLADVVEAWKGAERSSRDFYFPGGVSIEVKTTTKAESVHTSHSLSQANPERDEDGVPTEALYWLSVGLDSPALGNEEIVSIHSLVDEILQEVRRVAGRQSAIERIVLGKIRRFGTGDGPVFDPDAGLTPEVFSVEYAVRFMRLYDMCSNRVKVIRPHDVEGRAHAITSSVAFRVRLPESLGEGNPETDLSRFTKQLVDSL